LEHQEIYGIRAASAVDALWIGAANSRLREMRLLLADGVDVNGIASYSGGTALHRRGPGVHPLRGFPTFSSCTAGSGEAISIRASWSDRSSSNTSSSRDAGAARAGPAGPVL